MQQETQVFFFLALEKI